MVSRIIEVEYLQKIHWKRKIRSALLEKGKLKTKSTKNTFTREAKWTQTGLRFQSRMKTSSVHMTFHFCCIPKRPDILMDMCRHFISGSVYMIISSPEMKFYFCQNDRYEIHTRNELQTHMRIKHNFLRVCAYSVCFGSHENLMPVLNFISVKMTDMKSIPFWVSFRLNSCERK